LRRKGAKKVEKKSKITTETEVSSAELACVLGITGRRIRQLGEDGQLTKTGTGTYNLVESVQKYIAIASRARNEPSEEEKKRERQRLSAETSLKQSKAVKAGLEVSELQGKLHRSEDVAAMTEDLIYTVRSMYLSLPGRLAVDTHNSASSAEAAEIIRRTIYSDMKELSRYQYDPEKYAERVRARQQWESLNGADDDD